MNNEKAALDVATIDSGKGKGHSGTAISFPDTDYITIPHEAQAIERLLRRGEANARTTDEIMTATGIHGVLSKALNTAVKVGYLRHNPAELCITPKIEKKEISPLTDAQIKDFVTLCNKEDYGNIYKLILFTGLREGEALGLTWDCVDFDTGTLKINKKLQRQGGQEALVPLKNSKPRYLTAPSFVMQVLRDERTRQITERFAAGEAWQGWKSEEEMKSSLVFVRENGNNITAAAVYHRYKHLAEQIGASKSRVHDLRHTYAVLSLQNGDDVKTVQGNLGHATAAFTLDVYGHVSERMKENSAARMQAYIEKMA